MTNREKSKNSPPQEKSIVKEIQKIQKLNDKKMSEKSDEILHEMKNKNLIK